MDILLAGNGDLKITTDGDILLGDSVAQKIRIKLGWHQGEWQWDRDEGLPYLESVFVKTPDTDLIERLIREKIFEVTEVTEVKDVSVTIDAKSRDAVIRYTALTDAETIKEELRICRITE